jgi:serine/threonine protein kinase
MLSHGTLLQNRYRVIRRIGQGGMGAVYEARHEELGHSFALKEAFHTDDESLRRAFKREARTLAGLQHPGLPRVIDYFAEGDGLYLVMEYVEGDDLLKLLGARGEPFPAEEVMGWTEQLLDVLEYLHTRPTPVIHRDIKPSNVKLSPRGNVVLLDFGLSKGVSADASSVVASRSVLGFTLTYAPLEQILKADPNLAQHLTVVDADRVERILQTPTDASSDIYSLAATLYHLLTNRQPTQAPTRAVAVWSGKPDPLRPADEVNPRVPADLAALLQRALRLESAERVGSAAEMRGGLAEVRRRLAQPTEPAPEPPPPRDGTQEEEETVSPPPAPPPRPQLALQRLLAFVPGRLRPYALPAAGVLLLVLFLSAASLLRPSYDPPFAPAANVAGVTATATPAPSPPPLPRPESLADDDLIPFRKGDNWGFSLADRTPFIEPKYAGVEPFDGGLARVKYEEKTGGGNSRGDKVSKSTKYGFINKAGEVVIKVDYRRAEAKNDMIRAFPLSNSQPDCFRRKDGGVDPIVCPTPTPAPSPTASRLTPTPTPKADLSKLTDYPETGNKGKCGFNNGYGRVATGYVYDSCDSFYEDLAKVKTLEGWGFIDRSGRMQIRPSFKEVGNFSGGFARAKGDNDYWGLIDKSGKWVVENKYDDVRNYSEGLACVRDHATGKYGYVESSGKVWIGFEYDGADPFKGGVARVKKVSREGDKDVVKYGYINAQNKLVFSISYEAIEFPFDGEWAKFQRDGKWGLVDKAEKVVIEPKYKKIEACGLSGKLSNKLWKVELDGGIFFYIGRDGTEYYEPEDTAKELSWVAPSRLCFGLEDAAFRDPLDSYTAGPL